MGFKKYILVFKGKLVKLLLDLNISIGPQYFFRIYHFFPDQEDERLVKKTLKNIAYLKKILSKERAHLQKPTSTEIRSMGIIISCVHFNS